MSTDKPSTDIEVESQSVMSADGTPKFRVSATVTQSAAMQDFMSRDFLAEVARQMAERYVAEHYAEIAAKIDQQAIATLVVAESGAAISKEIHNLSDAMTRAASQQTRKEVYQRGVFGGMKRIL